MSDNNQEIAKFLNDSQEHVKNIQRSRDFLNLMRSAIAAKTNGSLTTVKNLTDVAYQTGGVPNDNSPIKLDQMAEKLGQLISILYDGGYGIEINRKLMNYGVQITKMPSYNSDIIDDKFESRLDKLYNKYEFNHDVGQVLSLVSGAHDKTTYDEMYQKYIDVSKNLQFIIDSSNKHIKEVLVEDLMHHTNIQNKSVYVSAAFDLYRLNQKLGQNNENEDKVNEKINEKLSKILESEQAVMDVRSQLNIDN